MLTPGIWRHYAVQFMVPSWTTANRGFHRIEWENAGHVLRIPLRKPNFKGSINVISVYWFGANKKQVHKCIYALYVKLAGCYPAKTKYVLTFHLQKESLILKLQVLLQDTASI